MVCQTRLPRGGPVGTGYGAAAIDIPEHGLYGPFFSKVGKCSNPNFRAPGLAVAQVDLWIIDYMAAEKRIVPKDVIVVGQSAGGWAAIALSSLNPPQVRAIVVFAGGRGGRVDGKPNNNCAPDRLVEATGEFGRTSRVPMLWIYIENDTFFGPALSKRMHEAFTAAGGKAEYHLVPPFGNDGHFFVGSPDAIPDLVAAGGESFSTNRDGRAAGAWRRSHDRSASKRSRNATAQHAPLRCLPGGGRKRSSIRPAPAVSPNRPTYAPRGQREVKDVTYGDWRKLCFKPGGAQMHCRTSISGTFRTGQMAVRLDIIERDGDGNARLQVFSPSACTCRSRSSLRSIKGSPIACLILGASPTPASRATVADPKMIQEMGSGQTLRLEFVDSNLLTLTTSLPLRQFASVNKGAPAQTFEHDIDE
jgi:dienelactone hydrolase